jgi:signal transduction histidine kinase
LLQVADDIKHSTEMRTSEEVDINQLLLTAVEKVRRAFPASTAKVEIRLDLADDLPQISIDRTGLMDVCHNVIRNALDAMPDGGALTLTSAVAAKDGSNFVQLTITDTGIGIPDKVLPRVFDLFFTTKKTGWGFGLWHDKNFLNQMGGDIGVFSEDGKGSTFTLLIPMAG